MRRTEKAYFLVFLTITCVIIAICTMVWLVDTNDYQARGSSQPQSVIVYDRSQHVMPVYNQTDPDWAGTPYLSGTIGSHGCGLVCASMAYGYIFGEELEPDELLEMVGDTCSTDGVNDMMKFARWLSDNYYGGIRYERVWLLTHSSTESTLRTWSSSACPASSATGCTAHMWS